VDWRPIHWLKFVETLHLNRRQPRFSGFCWARDDDYRCRAPVSAHRFYSRTGRCRPEFCNESVEQTSRDPKLVVHRNRKCLSHFRSINEGTHHRSRASASAQSSWEADCHWERKATQSQHSLAHKSGTVVYDLSANGLLHLNRGLPRSTVYDLSTVRQPEVRGEISPRIKCSSLRFECNRLLCLNRGLPWERSLRFKYRSTAGSTVSRISAVSTPNRYSSSSWRAIRWLRCRL
jgi:hypothetical protein